MVIQRAGRLDVLVNNAGYDLYAAAEDTSWAEMTAQIEVNFYGAVRMIQAVHPRPDKGLTPCTQYLSQRVYFPSSVYHSVLLTGRQNHVKE